eukprot:28574-Pelagococcus_subviridis.AAC.2
MTERAFARVHAERVRVRVVRRHASHQHLRGHVRQAADHVLPLEPAAGRGAPGGDGHVPPVHGLPFEILGGINRRLQRRAQRRLRG